MVGQFWLASKRNRSRLRALTPSLVRILINSRYVSFSGPASAYAAQAAYIKMIKGHCGINGRKINLAE